MNARLNDTEWLRRQISADNVADEDRSIDTGEAFGRSSDVATGREAMIGDSDVGTVFQGTAAGDYEAPSLPHFGVDADSGIDARERSNRKISKRVIGLVIAGVAVLVAGAVMLYGGDESRAKQSRDSLAEPAAVATTPASVSVSADVDGTDHPLPFTASADCPPGSTSAQTLAGADSVNAFVCVRNRVDGQVVELGLPKTFVITAISITPGWVGKDSSGTSQWSQHRVVTRVQYVFNDTDHTMVMQETGNVHGEAVLPIKHVLASRITMLILQTSRPPVEPSTSAGPTPSGGLLNGLFDGNGPNDAPPSTSMPPPLLGSGGQTPTDPVDATFAISNLKIIGHEAI